MQSIHPGVTIGIPPRKSWEDLFAKAEAEGEKPEKDVFEGMGNESDQTEWEWYGAKVQKAKTQNPK